MRGSYWRVDGPDGATYTVQAAPAGYVAWSTYTVQSPVGWLYHAVVTQVLNRLVFRGRWTVVVWRGDRIAPKRETVAKRRFPTEAEAVRAAEELRDVVARSGLPLSPGS